MPCASHTTESENVKAIELPAFLFPSALWPKRCVKFDKNPIDVVLHWPAKQNDNLVSSHTKKYFFKLKSEEEIRYDEIFSRRFVKASRRKDGNKMNFDNNATSSWARLDLQPVSPATIAFQNQISGKLNGRSLKGTLFLPKRRKTFLQTELSSVKLLHNRRRDSRWTSRRWKDRIASRLFAPLDLFTFYAIDD